MLTDYFFFFFCYFITFGFLLFFFLIEFAFVYIANNIHNDCMNVTRIERYIEKNRE